MKRLFMFSLCIASIFLSGCTQEEVTDFYKKAKDIPAQMAVDTVGKLVTIEGMFSTPNYAYTPESLEKLFLKNEYYVIVTDYDFFYCYDTKPRTFKEMEFDANYAVIGTSKLDKQLVLNGTAPFREKWKDLKNLSPKSRTDSRFKFELDIRDGECFEIEINQDYIESLPQNKLLKLMQKEPTEWEKAWKEMKNFTTPIENLFDSIRSEEKSEPLPKEEAEASAAQ